MTALMKKLIVDDAGQDLAEYGIALAVQDAPAQLFDANTEQLLVLALDLAAAGFVLGEVLLPVLGVVLVAVEDGERLGLAAAALVALPRARHGRIIPP